MFDIARLTDQNKLTLPEAVLSSCKGAEYFGVIENDGRIILIPVPPCEGDEVREYLAELGITQKDVDDAVKWARSQ